MVETVVNVERSTTTQSAPTDGGFSALRINIGYFQTVPGIVKLVQFVFGILCIALASPAFLSATHFFLFVVVVAFITTLLWIFAYLLGIREALNRVVLLLFIELVNTGLAAVLYFISSIIQLTAWSAYVRGHVSNIAAGVFGIFNFLAYAIGTYFLYLDYKSGATL